jgi:hypothetical protein
VDRGNRNTLEHAGITAYPAIIGPRGTFVQSVLWTNPYPLPN